jgi:hypothetical protein
MPLLGIWFWVISLSLFNFILLDIPASFLIKIALGLILIASQPEDTLPSTLALSLFVLS